jgi:hypothetical protein
MPSFVREEKGKYIQPVLAAYIHASNYVNKNIKYKVFSVQGDEGIGDRILVVGQSLGVGVFRHFSATRAYFCTILNVRWFSR